MPPSQKDSVIKYWYDGSKKSLQLAHDVLKKKYYDHALFCGHLALEKLLKAKVVAVTSQPAPFSHDLVYLAELAGIELTTEQKQQLTTINTFNIAGRYPEEKLEFHKRITKPIGTRWLTIISNLYLWLSQQPEKN